MNETTLSKTLMEKTMRLKEYEKINKNLVAQLSSYQEASEKENYNKIQEELEKKKRELKKKMISEKQKSAQIIFLVRSINYMKTFCH